MIKPGRAVALLLLLALLAPIPGPAAADHPELNSYDDVTAAVQRWREAGAQVAAPVRSLLGRDVHEVVIGEGPVTLLMLGALHANEPTGTEAIVQLIDALLGDLGPALQQPGLPTIDRDSAVLRALADPVVRVALLDRVRIVALPMLDPDGVEAAHTRNTATQVDYLPQLTTVSQAIQAAVDRHHPDVIIDNHGGPDAPDLNVGLVEPLGTDQGVLGESRRIAETVWQVGAAAGVTMAYFEERPGELVTGSHGDPIASVDEAYYGSLTRTVPLLQESYQLEGIPVIYTETVGLQSRAPSITIAEGASAQFVAMAGLALAEAGLVDGRRPGGIETVTGPALLGVGATVDLTDGADRLVAALRWRSPGADAALVLMDADRRTIASAEVGEDPPTGRRSRTIVIEDVPPGRYTLEVSSGGPTGSVPVDAALRAVWWTDDPASAVVPGVRAPLATARLCTVGSTVWSESVPAHLAGPRCPVVERQAGVDRTATAAALSRRTTDRADVVVIVRADQPADALIAAPLAAALGGPVLLTDRDALSPAAEREVRRLRATRAILLGGGAAVAPAVEGALADLGATVERIAAEDRFATAALTASRIGTSNGVVVALGAHGDPGRAWPDALSGAALAAATGRPLLLTESTVLPLVTAEAIAAGTPVTVIGGEDAIAPAVVRGIMARGATVTRVAGTSRYATSAAVAEAALAAGASPAVVHVATGRSWPDALAAATAAGRVDGVLLLVDGQVPDGSPETMAVLDRLADDGQVTSVRIAGGPQAVTRAVERAIVARAALR